jgi:dolichyl-phosphate beta-glucosyltransferase
MTPNLSVVIPAYNEADRLPPFLADVRGYLRRTHRPDGEVIVVDDGSLDGLGDAVRRIAADWPQLTLLRHESNRGKGAALRTGILAASGEFILLADADGATPIEHEAGLREALERGADVAVGSRLCDGRGVSRQRHWHRALSGRTFAWLTRHLLALPVRDTQCGFKMFRQATATGLIPRCRERGYLLDVELLALAQQTGCRIAEVAVSWRDVPGSKLRVARDGPKMLLGLWRVRGSVLAQMRSTAPLRGEETPAVGAIP